MPVRLQGKQQNTKHVFLCEADDVICERVLMVWCETAVASIENSY